MEKNDYYKQCVNQFIDFLGLTDMEGEHKEAMVDLFTRAYLCGAAEGTDKEKTMLTLLNTGALAGCKPVAQ